MKIIELCEDSMNRNGVHMMIRCGTCSYNDFREQQAMEQLIRFVKGENGEPG